VFEVGILLETVDRPDRRLVNSNHCWFKPD